MAPPDEPAAKAASPANPPPEQHSGRRKLWRWVRGLLLVLLLLGVLAGATFVWFYFSTMGGYYVQKTVVQNLTLPRQTINNVLLHTVSYGDSNTTNVLVLHDGPGGDMLEMQALLRLRDSFRVVFYDQRGTGLSARVPDSLLTLQQLTNEAAAVAQHWFGDTATYWVIGQGFGARLALLLSKAVPNQLRGLILVAPRELHPDHQAGEATRRQGWAYRRRAFRAWFEQQHIRYKGDPEAPEDHYFNRLYPLNPHYPTCPQLNNRQAMPLWRGGYSAWRCLHSVLFPEGAAIATDFTTKLPQELHPNTRVLAGACDQRWGPAFQRKQWQPAGLPPENIIALPRCGLHPFREAPDTTLKAIRAFLRKSMAAKP